MSKKILVTAPPIISNVPRDNFIFTVLNNSKNVLDTFILHNYIDTLSIYNEGSRDFYFRFRDAINCFVQKNYFLFSFIAREIIEPDNNVIHIIKKFINSNFYVLVNIDCFYIKNYNANHHHSHEIMIFGYDDDLRLFYVKDFFDGKLYTSSECTYSEFSTAFKSYKEHNFIAYYDGVLALKLNPNPDLSIDYTGIRTTLINYSNALFYNNAKRNYGISIFDAVEYQLSDERNHGAPVSFLIVKFNFIRDNIILMKMRIDFFSKIYSYEFSDEKVALDNLIKRVENLTNIFLKKFMEHKRFDIHEDVKFICKIKEIRKLFQEIIHSFTNKLDEKFIPNNI